MNIRRANIDDASDLLKIYEYYILNTAITFEIEIPSVEEFKERIKEISSFYPYLVLEDNNKIYGYAYAHPYIKRNACIHDVEISIYLDNDLKGNGYGTILYNALEDALRKMNIINLYSAIAYKEHLKYINDNSIKFHEKHGYERVGFFLNAGYKFNCWYDLLWYAKNINSYDDVKDVLNYNNVK